jgi:hypothetical protein
VTSLHLKPVALIIYPKCLQLCCNFWILYIYHLLPFSNSTNEYKSRQHVHLHGKGPRVAQLLHPTKVEPKYVAPSCQELLCKGSQSGTPLCLLSPIFKA